MNRPAIILSVLIGMTVGSPAIGITEPTLPDTDTALRLAQAPAPPSDLTKPVYKPHGAIAPRARIFGATRGRVDGEPAVLALVPDHVGYTTSRQPTLFWYLSKTTSRPITLTLIDTRSIKPILHVKLGQPAQSGVQMIKLKDYSLSLEEAVQYRWFVSLVVDPDSPSRDVVTGGVIEYLDPKLVSLDEASACQDRQDKVCRYAEAGLWYDALAAASEQITAAPKDKLLRKKRASLLQQVDLNEPAEWDLSQSRAD